MRSSRGTSRRCWTNSTLLRGSNAVSLRLRSQSRGTATGRACPTGPTLPCCSPRRGPRCDERLREESRRRAAAAPKARAKPRVHPSAASGADGDSLRRGETAMSGLEPWAAGGYELAEGARWVDGRLVFVDIPTGRLIELRA